MTDQSTRKQNQLRALPSIDALLRTGTALSLREAVGAKRLAEMARSVTDELRAQLLSRSSLAADSNGGHARESLLAEAERKLGEAFSLDRKRGIRRVINASGVILHTNLGRAPLSVAARRAVSEEAAGYCTLEYDTNRGERGKRGERAEQLLAELAGAEGALVVNNCAAAAMLVLTVLARGGETIISRGELVEIGGDFRVPDVMAQSGTQLVEVGTTNRTKLSDYEREIAESTRLLMRVHPSNYRIVGFTATPSLPELAGLAHNAGLPLYEDAGSGALIDMRTHGLAGEPVIRESIAHGADVVTFSGDKLLGASQAGLVVGRREIIERLRRHPLYRALRADKLALAALEATLEIYRRGAAVEEVPAIRMIALTKEEIEARVRGFIKKFKKRPDAARLHFEIMEGESAIGGGSAPTTHPPTSLIAVKHETFSADALEQSLRGGTPPVIARIAEDRVLLDLRTVMVEEEAELMSALLAAASASGVS